MIPERFREERFQSPNPVTRELIENGFCILRSVRPEQEMLAMSRQLDDRFERTPYSVGHFHGHRTKRFHRLISRLPGSIPLVLEPSVLAATRAILAPWCDFPEINLTQGVEVHPEAPAQIPHADQSMWPVPKGDMELCVNVFWPLVEFTADNGATRVWRGTHAVTRDPSVPLPEPVICTMTPGDALVVLGSTVHAAGANATREPRRALIVSYCLGWLKAYENQSLAYSRDEVRSFPPELQDMLGYRWHRPNLGTYDGQCPSILIKAEVPDHLATVDALSTEHETLVSRFAVAQLPGVH